MLELACTKELVEGFNMLENTILIVIALIAIAVAAIFINRYLSLKEKAGAVNGQSTVDVNLIEQAALAKSLQEQVEQLTDELNSLEHTSTCLLYTSDAADEL